MKKRSKKKKKLNAERTKGKKHQWHNFPVALAVFAGTLDATGVYNVVHHYLVFGDVYIHRAWLIVLIFLSASAILALLMDYQISGKD